MIQVEGDSAVRYSLVPAEKESRYERFAKGRICLHVVFWPYHRQPLGGKQCFDPLEKPVTRCKTSDQDNVLDVVDSMA